MQELKRILSLVVVFAMLLSVSAFAAEGETESEPEIVTAENVEIPAVEAALETAAEAVETANGAMEAIEAIAPEAPAEVEVSQEAIQNAAENFDLDALAAIVEAAAESAKADAETAKAAAETTQAASDTLQEQVATEKFEFVSDETEYDVIDEESGETYTTTGAELVETARDVAEAAGEAAETAAAASENAANAADAAQYALENADEPATEEQQQIIDTAKEAAADAAEKSVAAKEAAAEVEAVIETATATAEEAAEIVAKAADAAQEAAVAANNAAAAAKDAADTIAIIKNVDETHTDDEVDTAKAVVVEKVEKAVYLAGVADEKAAIAKEAAERAKDVTLSGEEKAQAIAVAAKAAKEATKAANEAADAANEAADAAWGLAAQKGWPFYQKVVTAKGVIVTARAQAGVFPRDTVLTAEDVEAEAVESTEGAENISVVTAVDINFWLGEANIQPDTSKGLVDVTIEDPNAEIADDAALTVGTIVNDVAETVEGATVENGVAAFTTDHFTVYYTATELSAYVAEIVATKKEDHTFTDIIKAGANVESLVDSGGRYFAGDLQDAINAAATGATVKMLKDVTIDGNKGVTVAANQNIVLDLNGRTLKNGVNEDKASYVILNQGTLTIQDSSDTNADGTGNGLIVNAVTEGTNPGDWWSTPRYNYATNTITNNGTLIVASGKIQNSASKSICYAVDTTVSFTLNGGLVLNEAGGFSVRQGYYTDVSANIVTINDGTIRGGLWMQQPSGYKETKPTQPCVLNVTGGHLIGPNKAFYNTSEGTSTRDSEINISGGEFVGTVVFWSRRDPIQLTITDGTFTSVDSSKYSDAGSHTNKFIEGGRYLNKPDADLIKEGYAAWYEESDGYFHVGTLDEAAGKPTGYTSGTFEEWIPNDNVAEGYSLYFDPSDELFHVVADGNIPNGYPKLNAGNWNDVRYLYKDGAEWYADSSCPEIYSAFGSKWLDAGEQIHIDADIFMTRDVTFNASSYIAYYGGNLNLYFSGDYAIYSNGYHIVIPADVTITAYQELNSNLFSSGVAGCVVHKEDNGNGTYTYSLAAASTVTFASNGGSTVTSATVETGSSVAAPSDPTRMHYSFDGWYVDEDLTTAYVFTSNVNEDITLYAGWTYSDHDPADAVIENNVLPTCEEDGSYDTVVYCAIDGEELSRVTTEVAALGHDFTDDPEWTWDGEAATAEFTCANDPNHVETVTAVVTAETTEATYAASGSIVYTATVEFEGETYTDTYTVEIPQLVAETPVSDGESEPAIVSAAGTAAPAAQPQQQETVSIEEEATPLAALPESLSEVLVAVTNEAGETVEVAVSELPVTFVDVAEDSFARDAIAYVEALGLMNGTGSNENGEATFSPTASTTGDMLATILYRATSGEETSGENWAEAATAWAADNNLAEGMGIEELSQLEVVSREQMVTVMYRVAEARGFDVAATNDLLKFTDTDELSDYARAAMEWAVSVGLIKGTDVDKLSPNAEVTREQIALILMRFNEMTKDLV